MNLSTKRSLATRILSAPHTGVNIDIFFNKILLKNISPPKNKSWIKNLLNGP